MVSNCFQTVAGLGNDFNLGKIVQDCAETCTDQLVIVRQKNAHWFVPRLEYVAGDVFRDDLPSADAFLLKTIIHDWDDARCISILRNCCKRLDVNGRVVCVDAVLPPLGDTGDVPGKLLDVNIMLVLPGKERTRAEWEALYHKPDWK